jgi:hypothetical protein
MNSTGRKAVISLAATLTFGAMMVAMTSETQARGGFGFRGGGVGFGGLRGVGFAGRGFAGPGLAGRGWGWGGRGWGGRGWDGLEGAGLATTRLGIRGREAVRSTSPVEPSEPIDRRQQTVKGKKGSLLGAQRVCKTD